jgi:ectoine hydroxylase-related dioxygenase (phytanoyl-CoA dioxygenase family)
MNDEPVLTPQQVADFRRDGYLVVRGLYTPREVEEIRAWTEALANSPEVAGRDWKYFEVHRQTGERILCRIENFVPFHEGFSNLIRKRRMHQAVSELFGEEAVLFKDKINFKLPGGDGFRAHQDVQAGWDDYGTLHITAMIALDETNEQNGSLEMIPGLHGRGLLGPKWAPLTDEHTDHRPYLAVHCRPGDAVFFDSFAPHRSGPNRTDRARRVLYITYNKTSEGDHRAAYYADKHRNYPPDVERDPNRDYRFKV